MPAGGGSTSLAPQSSNESRFGVRYNGTATVDGRSTYVLHIAPETENGSGTFSDYTQTLYVDAEYFFPLKHHTEWTMDGEPVETTVTYRNVTFNPGLDDSTFQFEPPEDATVSDIETPERDGYESVGDLRDDADMSVPDPALPESFELSKATRTYGEWQSVSIQYANATSRIGVSKYNVTDFNASDDAETVAIGGHEAAYRVIGTTKRLSWTCGEYRYAVSGSGVSKELLIRIGESVACE